MNDDNLETNEQPIQQPQSDPVPQSIQSSAMPPESTKQLKTVRILGTICLILGTISLLGWVTCVILTFLVDPFYHWFLLFLAWPCEIICFVCTVLLIICIVIKRRNHLPAKYALTKPILGTVFAFSIWAFISVTALIASTQQKNKTDGPSIVSEGTFSTCESSAKRALNDYFTVYRPELGISDFAVSQDAICSYLEYIYDHNTEPTTIDQLESYIQAYETKNNLVTVTIASDRPTSQNVYSILPHKACSLDDTQDNSTISVWYRNEKYENGFNCVDYTASVNRGDSDFNSTPYIKKDEYDLNRYLDIYDPQASHVWYESMFDPNQDNQ